MVETIYEKQQTFLPLNCFFLAKMTLTTKVYNVIILFLHLVSLENIAHNTIENYTM